MNLANNKISLLTQKQLPEFIQDEYPLFVRFIEAYYEFLENKQNGIASVTGSGGLGYSATGFMTITGGGTINTAANISFSNTNGIYTFTINNPGLYESTPTLTGPGGTSGTFTATMSSQDNDLYKRAKQLIDIGDVDKSLDEFEEQFFNTYLNLFPKDTDASKELLIKNSIPFYLSKGNEKSFKYFFKALFDEDVKIQIPKNDVLIASGGKWIVLKTLRATQSNVFLNYIAGQNYYNGSKSNTIFYLPDQYYQSNLTVIADGTQLSTSNYYIQREYKKLVLNTGISSNLKINIQNFDPKLLLNRKITGINSGASAIIENVYSYKNSGTDIFEFEINDKSLNGTFLNGENFQTNILDQEENLLNIQLNSFASLKKINITNGGFSYNVGDPVLLIGGSPTTSGVVYVSDVYKGNIDKIDVVYGGAGFKVGSPILASGISPYSISSAIVSVDTSQANSKNSYSINRDLIWDLAANTIADANYCGNGCFGYSGQTLINSANTLFDAFNYVTLSGIGPITKAYLLDSNTPTSITPKFNAIAANTPITSNTSKANFITSFISVADDDAIGRVDILAKGSGYQVGDKLDFFNVYGGTGYGARGAVTAVDSTGGIKAVELQPIPPSNTCFDVSIVASSNNIIGTGSTFTKDFKVSSSIIVFNQIRTIKSIISDTQMQVNDPVFSITKANTEIGLFNILPLGGCGYIQTYLPQVVVNSPTGSGASLKVTSLMGDGEIIVGSGLHPDGEIQSVEIVSSGQQYVTAPKIDLSGYGSKTATAIAEINESYYQYPGKYIGNDGKLSSEKKLQDSKVYNTGTYILKTKQQFIKFKNALLNLLHPAGTLAYCYYTPVESTIIPKIGGTSLDSASLKRGIINPILDLNFLTSNNLDSRITFTRGSSATYFNDVGILQTVTTNSPRIDYDPLSLSRKGLLIESPSTNLLLQSENFLTTWTTSNTSIVNNTGISPSNQATADKIVPNTVSDVHYIQQSVTVVNSTKYTLSVFAKADGETDITLYSDTTSPTTATFSISAGTLTSGTGNITTLKNGWYRISMTYTSTSTTSAVRIYVRTTSPFSGDGIKGFYLWGAQLERGPIVTSYIPTTTTSASRAGDNAVITGSNFSAIYSSTEGTIFGKGSLISSDNTDQKVLATISNGTILNYISILRSNNATSNGLGNVISSGTVQASLAGDAWATTTSKKLALGYKTNDFVFCKDGITPNVDTSGILPTVSQLEIGSRINSDYWNGWIEQISYYSVKFGNSAAQLVTT